MEKIVVLSDQQARFVDRTTWRAVLSFLKEFQPDIIVNNGDLVDFEALANFRRTLVERQSLMADLKAGRKLLTEERQACPWARIILVEGNHEERLTRYITDLAPELAGVPRLAVGRFILNGEAERLGVEYVGPYGVGFDWHGLLVYHGEYVRAHSAYTARAELERAGTSGVSGHTHRLGAHYFTDRRETHAWFENGCLCITRGRHVPPGERKGGVRDWQQGFSVGLYGNGVWNVYQVSVTRHKFWWGEKLYGPGGRND